MLQSEADLLPHSPRPPESFKVPKITKIHSATLITTDVHVSITPEQEEALKLSGYGWEAYEEQDAQVFLTRFEEVFEQKLEDYLASVATSKQVNWGGSSATTISHLVNGDNPINAAEINFPMGISATREDPLTNVANQILESRLAQVSGVKLIPTLHPDSQSPIILSFSVPGKNRQMVQFSGCKRRGVNQEAYSTDEAIDLGSQMHIMDAYEIAAGDTYTKAMNKAKGSNISIGLGSVHVIGSALSTMNELFDASTDRFTGISGNTEEAKVLCQHAGNGDENYSIQSYIMDHNLNYALISNGTEGATLYFNNGGELIEVSIEIPEDQIHNGDTINAGDVFFANVLGGILNLHYGTEDIQGYLENTLKDSAKATYDFLVQREKQFVQTQ